ncbi:MAG: hypothetical protein ACK52J_02480, partial [bacterium]
MNQLEKYFTLKDISIANVDGKKLLLLINKKTLTEEDCVSCLVNFEQVAIKLKIPKLMYKGENGNCLLYTSP